MTIPIFQVDAFTSQPFSGNPAAVCLLSEAAAEQWMQHVAREMNLSETAFLVRQTDGFGLRWFTPAVEVALCGHATLASAHILWQEGLLKPDETARFHSRSGLLTARRSGETIELDFPAVIAEPADAPSLLDEALGVRPLFVGKSRFDYLVQVESEAVLRGLRPNFTLLETLPIRGLIVTSVSATARYDFVSRFFAPAAGINEDPVTGSAHCCLGPFWRSRLGKEELLAYQASARGGEVRVRFRGERVLLGGHAVTVMRGELL
jgi:PhzF family phenazine biosynthesis protein